MCRWGGTGAVREKQSSPWAEGSRPGQAGWGGGAGAKPHCQVSPRCGRGLPPAVMAAGRVSLRAIREAGGGAQPGLAQAAPHWWPV